MDLVYLRNVGVHMIHKHIEIVSSKIKGASSMVRESRENVVAVLSRYYDEVGISIITSLADLEDLVARKPDLVFLGMKFLPQDDLTPDKIWLADYLDAHAIPYTGSNHSAHLLEAHKNLAKQGLLRADLQTSPYLVAHRGQPLAAQDVTIKYPVFIKPTNRGGGKGVDNNSVAHDFPALSAKVTSIATLNQADALIEEYLPGREFSVSIIKDPNSGAFSVMPLELVAPTDNGVAVLSEAVKSSNAEQVLVVAAGGLRDSLCRLGLAAFSVLGARDYGRIDIRLDAYGVPHFLEANLLPSLISGYGTFPKACELELALGYEAMILQIVELAMLRCYEESDDIIVADLDDTSNNLILEPAY